MKGEKGRDEEMERGRDLKGIVIYAKNPSVQKPKNSSKFEASLRYKVRPVVPLLMPALQRQR